LKMLKFIPKGLTKPASLIVLLHGCSQDAKEFVINTGWKDFAQKLGLILLIPEQLSANNSYRCFNWFELSDQQRGKGEAESISQMIKQIQANHNVDSKKIFVSGFSAGAAMAAVMLAAYPDVFEAGAIIAGVAYGCAQSATSALICMYGFSTNDTEQWVQKIKDAFPLYNGAYPRVSIWQGTDDATVKQVNAKELIKQWSGIHGVDHLPVTPEDFAGHERISYKKNELTLVESIMIRGLRHKVSINPTSNKDQCGTDGFWEKDMGICSTSHILKFWNLF
ncbi:MAG: PHB depolymerase family esterase, partial [Halobacteriovoraceae bacterium]|nr:PHB depolymerase family esterase [Halobacteriovoraceae bacterium]